MKSVRLLHRSLLLVAVMCWSYLKAQPLPELIPYKAATGWGYSDSNKVIKVPCIYRSASLFYNGKGRVTMERDGEVVHCVVDRTGKYIIGPEVHWTGRMNPSSPFGMLNSSDKKGRWGGIDTNGKVIIPFLYDAPRHPAAPVGYYNDRKDPTPRMVAARNRKWGLVDTAGKVLISFAYDRLKPVRQSSDYYEPDSLEGWLAHSGKAVGLYGPNGELLVPCRFDSIGFSGWSRERNGVAVLEGGRWGWYNLQSRQLIAPQFYHPPFGAGAYVRAYDSSLQRMVLLTSDGRTFFSEPFYFFELYHDSVVVVRQIEGRNGESDQYYAGRLDTSTKTVGNWRFLPNYMSVAGGRENTTAVEELFPDHAVFFGHDQDMEAYEKEGRTWEYGRAVVPQLDELPEPFGQWIAVRSYYSGIRKRMYGVADSSHHFLVPPQPHYEILGGNVRDNYLVVRPDRQTGVYGVTDLRLKALVNPQSRFIGAMFRWKGRPYLIASVEVHPYLYSTGPHGNRRFRPLQFTVTDGNGVILPGFENALEPKFFNEGGHLPLVAPINDIIQVTDGSAGATGFLHLDGSAAFPSIQYQYRNFRFLGPDIGTGTVPRTNKIVLLHVGGQPLIPAIDSGLVLISESGCEVAFPDFTVCRSEDRRGLYLLKYRMQANVDILKVPQEIYFDRHGTVYAGENALR